MELERASFVAGTAPGREFRASVRIRHRAVPVEPRSRAAGDRRWTVTTDTPVWAVSPGQAAVLYDGDEVLGGGRIARPAVLAASA